MVKIEVFGTGCPKCKQTIANAERAVKNLGIEAEIVKVDKLQEITKRGVMITPALAINGKIKISGKVPSPEQIEEWIKQVI